MARRTYHRLEQYTRDGRRVAEAYCFLLSILRIFVSIDTDLFAPVLAGLEFFYPRLSPGGFIFVHDYNNALFPGAKAAVQEFSARNGASFVPLTDIYGTAVFSK